MAQSGDHGVPAGHPRGGDRADRAGPRRATRSHAASSRAAGAARRRLAPAVGAAPPGETARPDWPTPEPVKPAPPGAGNTCRRPEPAIRARSGTGRSVTSELDRSAPPSTPCRGRSRNRRLTALPPRTPGGRRPGAGAEFAGNQAEVSDRWFSADGLAEPHAAAATPVQTSRANQEPAAARPTRRRAAAASRPGTTADRTTPARSRPGRHSAAAGPPCGTRPDPASRNRASDARRTSRRAARDRSGSRVRARPPHRAGTALHTAPPPPAPPTTDPGNAPAQHPQPHRPGTASGLARRCRRPMSPGSREPNAAMDPPAECPRRRRASRRRRRRTRRRPPTPRRRPTVLAGNRRPADADEPKRLPRLRPLGKRAPGHPRPRRKPPPPTPPRGLTHPFESRVDPRVSRSAPASWFRARPGCT